MKKTAIYLGTITALTVAAFLMIFLLPTNSKSGVTLQFTSQQEEGKQAVKDLMDYVGLEYELTSSTKGWTVKFQEDISDERFQMLKEEIQSGKELTFRDYQDKTMLTQEDIVDGSAELGERQNSDPKVVTLTLENSDKFSEVTNQISSLERPNNVLVIWFGYEEDQQYLDEKEKEMPSYLAAPMVNQRLKTNNIQITGGFSEADAKKMVDKINISTLSEQLELVENSKK